jgi:uncharacterized protein
MFVHAKKPLRWILLGLCIPIVTSCAFLLADPAPPPIYYVLTPVPEAEEAQSAGVTAAKGAQQRGPVVGVAPVSLPDYLDAPDIVTRSTRNILDITGQHNWAAPLADNVADVLADNLGVMIPTDRVTVLPGGPFLRSDYQVSVDVSKFERDVDGRVTLIARWVLFGEDGREMITMRRSIFRQPAPADDYDAIVAAMSTTLAQLSAEIAAAVGAHRGGRV